MCAYVCLCVCIPSIVWLNDLSSVVRGRKSNLTFGDEAEWQQSINCSSETITQIFSDLLHSRSISQCCATNRMQFGYRISLPVNGNGEKWGFGGEWSSLTNELNAIFEKTLVTVKTGKMCSTVGHFKTQAEFMK